MGVYQRGYMQRSDGGAGWVDWHSVNTWVLAVNLVVFVCWQVGFHSRSLGLFLREHFLLHVGAVLHQGHVHTLLTCEFSHYDLWHLAFNMLYLWWAGREVEGLYGRRNYAVLYLSCALSASLASLGLHTLLQEPGATSLGASGAISGVMVVFACHFPNRQVWLYGMLPVNVRAMLIVFLAIDLLGAIHNTSNIERAAHLGGALAGYLYYRFDLRLPRGRRAWSWPSWLRWSRQATPDRDGADTSGSARSEQIDPATARQVDALLDKIAREGISSLSQDERAFLQETSRRYRPRD